MFWPARRRHGAEDMTRMLDSIRQGLYAPPRGALYYSCLAVCAGLFGPHPKSSGDPLGLGDFPWSASSVMGRSRTPLYGYTGVLTLFI